MDRDQTLRRYRLVLGAFIFCLVMSGVTAFPLRHELELLSRILGVPSDAPAASQTGLSFWVATVRDGLWEAYSAHPWLGYGTDWLAFGHIVISLFFIGPWRAPVANAWVLKIGLVACAGVLPLPSFAGRSGRSHFTGNSSIVVLACSVPSPFSTASGSPSVCAPLTPFPRAEPFLPV